MIINDFTKRRNITFLPSSDIQKINTFLIQDFVPKLTINEWIAPRDIYGARYGSWANIPLGILYNYYYNKYKDDKKAHTEAGKKLGLIIINLLRDLPEEFEVGEGFRTKLYKRIQLFPEKISSADEDEQISIAEGLSKLDRDNLKKQLKNIKNTKPDEIIEFHGKKYKRNNLAIALIKHLRGYKCQICETAIRKKDGSFYIEAAHIKPKSQQGTETPDNILILCPNHHKEFDLGKREIIEHTEYTIVFKLNGDKKYNIPLEIK